VAILLVIRPKGDRVKVRWKHDSLRLRITPSELEDLLRGKQISERFDLSDGAVWEIAIYPNSEENNLRNVGPVVHVLISREDQKKLADPETQGIYFTTDRSGRDLIRYFIEKDFPCVHPRAADALESPSETFAPPPGFVPDDDQ
jgi:hypothetical protein